MDNRTKMGCEIVFPIKVEGRHSARHLDDTADCEIGDWGAYAFSGGLALGTTKPYGSDGGRGLFKRDHVSANTAYAITSAFAPHDGAVHQTSC